MHFDALKELDPISTAIVNVNPGVLAALDELFACAKTWPRQLNLASQGNGTVSHLGCAQLANMAGIEWTHVPYKGSAQAITDLVSGNVQVMCDSVAASLPHIRSGKLRALAVVGARRSPLLPDVPTVAEAALPGYKVESWTGLMAPGGTPKPVIDRLHQEIVRTLADPAVIKRLSEAGFQPRSSTPEAYVQQIRDDLGQWAGVVKAT